MSTPAERYLAQATITPNWITPSSFWYLRTAASIPATTEFFLVEPTASDPESRRRSAFDHAVLAEKLAEHTGREVNPSELPFRWIEFSPEDLAAVRFRFDGKVFQFNGASNVLEIWEGDFGTKLEPLDGDVATVYGGPPAGLTVVNKTSARVKLYWIDGSGKSVDYGTVNANGEMGVQTYTGHTWLVEGGDGQEAKYRVVEGESFIILEPGWGRPKNELRESEVDGGVTDIENLTLEGNGIFVRDGDVWIRDSDDEHKITNVSDDPSGFRYDSDTITSSPDGKFAVVWKFSPEQSYTLHLVESTPDDQLQPKLKSTSYAKPGDKVRIDRPCMFDLEAKREVPTDDALFANPYGIRELGWGQDSQEYRFEFNERGHKNLRIIGMNTQGTVRPLVQETSSTFVNYSQKRYSSLSPDTSELIWASERSGYNHLYLYDLQTASVKTQVTQGSWVVREVERISWESRQVWLTIFGFFPDQDPYYAHLAVVHLDDPSTFTVLTSGNGTHSWTWTPSNTYLFDTYSRVDQLPVTTLRDSATGAELCTLEADSTPSLLSEGWIPPQIFTTLARDNSTPIYGIIIPPSNLDPSSPKTYTILEDIYASPHSFFTPKSFQTESDLSSQYEFAAAGFVVVKLDGMGTNWRSKAFHDVCHKNLKDSGIPDRINFIREAAKSRPWMDLSRVGIYGGSAGGQSAVSALIFHRDDDDNEGFYKAAAADCGCHDNRLDKLWWNEQWMGWPVDEAYEANSNVVHAANLRGQVMLSVGELDDNVDPASTLQVVKRLNEARRDYKLLFMPGMGHGAGGGDYGRRRRLAFFKMALGGEGN